MQPSSGGVDSFTIPLPNNLALRGLPVFTQAVIQGGEIELTNAIDLVLGL